MSSALRSRQLGGDGLDEERATGVMRTGGCSPVERAQDVAEQPGRPSSHRHRAVAAGAAQRRRSVQICFSATWIG